MALLKSLRNVAAREAGWLGFWGALAGMGGGVLLSMSDVTEQEANKELVQQRYSLSYNERADDAADVRSAGVGVLYWMHVRICCFSSGE